MYNVSNMNEYAKMFDKAKGISFPLKDNNC